MVEKEAETNKKMAISEAEKNANVSRILMEQKLMEKESSRRQQEIDNHIYLAREKSLADANYYRYFSPFAFPTSPRFEMNAVLETECVVSDIMSFHPFISVLREAEANKLKLTPQFLELKFIEAIADNTKIFFGDKARALSLFALDIYALRVYN